MSRNLFLFEVSYTSCIHHHKMAATLLSYVSSKDQLKWQGTKESLLTFLSSRLQVDSSDIQVKDNGTCSVMKGKGMTFNFYVKAKTLQIQGKENANQLRADLVNLACTENSNNNYTPELGEQDGVEASRPSDEGGDEDKTPRPINHPLSTWTVLCLKDLMLPILTLK